MSKPKEVMIPRADAVKAVALTCRRLGMLHIAFAATLVKELGEEKGEELARKAIKEYARMIGEKKKEIALKQGWELTKENFRKLSDLPAFGMHDKREEVVVDGENRHRAYGCAMSKVWHEYGQDKLGRIYCYVDPASAMVIGAVSAVVCFLFVSVIKPRFGYDDALDAFGVHGAGGILGTLAVGLFASKAVNPAGADGLFFGNPRQFWIQLVATAVTAAYSFVATWILYKLVDVLIGVRVSDRDEAMGLDLTQHNERANTILE